ncbi:hypothetical protein Q3G72_001145 [Acer saccharum]|nr:hypothetical protein Q3G72_001145 [Acer saccharum]
MSPCEHFKRTPLYLTFPTLPIVFLIDLSSYPDSVNFLMGGLLSLAGPKCKIRDYVETSANESCKKQKISPSVDEEGPRLIPSLPDELSIQILARLPRICYFNLRLVSRKWKATIMNPELFNVRKELGMREEWLYVLTKVEDDKLLWHALDPLSRKWQRLPPLPSVINDEEEPRNSSSGLWMWNMVAPSFKIAKILRGWLGWKDTSDPTPFCGCAIGAVDGCLYVLGGFSRTSTVYDQKEDAWKVVIGKVPICDFTDSESPYLLAGFHGKLHVITKDADHKIAVLRADLRDNLSSMSSSSTSLSADSVDEHSDTLAELDTVVWKVIASEDFGFAELVSCQVIDI